MMCWQAVVDDIGENSVSVVKESDNEEGYNGEHAQLYAGPDL